MSLFRELSHYRYFLREFVLQQMRSRYRGSILGYTWALIVPVITVCTLAFVFSYINRVDMQKSWPFFVGGYVPWAIFASALTTSAGSIIANAHFVTRIHAPSSVFPSAAFVMALIEGVGFAGAAMIGLALFGQPFHLTFLFLPIAVAIFLPFVFGCCFLLAALNVPNRDVAYLWTAFSTLLFFLTPILYPITTIPAHVRPFFEANPLYPMVRLFQDPLLGSLPPIEIATTAAIYSVITVVLGITVFRRTQRSFYRYL